jgi:uncharacterized protein YbjT (DUF2867 family)
MIPPRHSFFDHSFDITAYVGRLAGNYAHAVRESGVKRVVQLSSIGAHLEKGTGLLTFYYDLERTLANLPDVAITFMRPTAFHYNLYGYIAAIKNAGVIAANYGGEDKTTWVSPIDIAAAIAEEITTRVAAGTKVRYVASDELTCNEVASILGTAIGKPDLKWVVISDEQMKSNLEAAGMNPVIAAGMVEMYASAHTGVLGEDYNRHRPAVLGKVKMKDFAKEFAAAFNQ